jgi:phosphoribosylformimino-5-aminoimidazole carboxamide ribotide isomerase
MARHWQGQGAQHLHLVDLDGARDGRLVNRPVLQAIVEALNIPCELGGGVRDEHTIGELLALGLNRVVIGTRALREPDWFRGMCLRFPHQLVLGLDARGGRAATDGWLKTSNVAAIDLARQFVDLPLAAVVYTDIATDGMLQGPNLAALAEMRQAIDLPLVASGGVTSADDVAALRRLGMDGCIIGRALYEDTLTMAEALAAAKGGPKKAS